MAVASGCLAGYFDTVHEDLFQMSGSAEVRPQGGQRIFGQLARQCHAEVANRGLVAL